MPQDREEEMRRLDPPRDDIAHGAGGVHAGREGRSFLPGDMRPEGLREDLAFPPEGPAPVEVATGDRHDSYLEADPHQGLKARFTEPACGPPQAVHDEPATPDAPIENAAILPDAPSAWDARPRP